MGVHFFVFYFYLIIYQYLNYFFESCRGYQLPFHRPQPWSAANKQS